jgi:hypothetical protein
MKKKLTINLSIIFLLIYLVSSPFQAFFHHHEHHVVAHHNASACEKSLYFHDDTDHCNDKNHINEGDPTCDLCEHHLFNTYTFSAVGFSFFSCEFITKQVVCYAKKHSNKHSLSSTRGPPIV